MAEPYNGSLDDDSPSSQILAIAHRIENAVKNYTDQLIKPIFKQWQGLFREIAKDVETVLLRAPNEAGFNTQREQIAAKLKRAIDEYSKKPEDDPDMFMSEYIHRFCAQIAEELNAMIYSQPQQGRPSKPVTVSR